VAILDRWELTATSVLETAIDRLITRQMAAQHNPGLALAITHNHQAIYVKGYGRANEPTFPTRWENTPSKYCSPHWAYLIAHDTIEV
jgi:CubicO group peptidase (beta-lactamase class C family)